MENRSSQGTMHRRNFVVGAAAVAASAVTARLQPVFAETPEGGDLASSKRVGRWETAALAQQRYEQVVKTGLGEPYMAPLRTDRDGPRYLWGGLDPIALVESYEHQIITDKGGIVFMNWGGAEIGKLEFPLEVPIYSGGPTKTALFRSAENRDRFRRQSAGRTLMVMCGLNCLWGMAAGPATADWARPLGSHFAQPGLAGIFVEKFPNPEGREVTTLGTTLYTRADDWRAVRPEGWGYIAASFQTLLQERKPWRRIRPYMPVVELDWENGTPR